MNKVYVISLLLTLTCISCEEKLNYKSVIIGYQNSEELRQYDSIGIYDKETLFFLQSCFMSAKKGSIIFQRRYTIKITTSDNKNWDLDGNGYNLRDSMHSFYIPKGQIRDSYLRFLKTRLPHMVIDSVLGDN